MHFRATAWFIVLLFLTGPVFFPHANAIFLFVSQAIADMVTEKHLEEGRLYPPLSDIREVSFKIAVKVADAFTYSIPKYVTSVIGIPGLDIVMFVFTPFYYRIQLKFEPVKIFNM